MGSRLKPPGGRCRCGAPRFGCRSLAAQPLAKCSPQALTAWPAAIRLAILIAVIWFEGFTTSPAFARVCHARPLGCPRAPDVRKHREEEPEGRSKKSFQEKSRKKRPGKKKGISNRRFYGNIIPPLTDNRPCKSQ